MQTNNFVHSVHKLDQLFNITFFVGLFFKAPELIVLLDWEGSVHRLVVLNQTEPLQTLENSLNISHLGELDYAKTFKENVIYYKICDISLQLIFYT